MIGDSVTMQYLALKDCELMTLKEIFNTVYFGFVLPKATDANKHQQRPVPSNENISNAIINLGQRGDLTELKAKWWPQQT